MDKLSFASRYRTAAILAALAHDHAPGEDPTGQGAPAFVAVHAAEEPRLRSMVLRLREAVSNVLRPGRAIAWRSLGHHVKSEDQDRAAPDLADAAWKINGRSEQLLVSHFAFCDDPEGSDSGMERMMSTPRR